MRLPRGHRPPVQRLRLSSRTVVVVVIVLHRSVVRTAAYTAAAAAPPPRRPLGLPVAEGARTVPHVLRGQCVAAAQQLTLLLWLVLLLMLWRY